MVQDYAELTEDSELLVVLLVVLFVVLFVVKALKNR